MSATRAPGATRLPGPVQRLGLFGLALSPVALAFGWGLAPQGIGLTALVLLVGLALALRGMARHYPHAVTGACNLVTTARLGLAAALAAALAAPGPGAATAWAVFALAALALLLDGLDGWLARRQGLSSEFGARYDMEVDALLAGLLALLLMVQGRAGPELLILGGARYGFVLAGLALPWLRAPLAPRLRRKVICVVQIGTLAALTLPAFPAPLMRPAAIGAAALLLWSFATDIRRLAGRG